MTVNISEVNELSDELIAALVTDDNPRARAYGRLLATEMPALLQRYMNEETERSTAPEIILDAVVRLAVTVVSSYLTSSSEESALWAIRELGRLFVFYGEGHQRSLRAGGG